jgi:hypothetical protein
MPEIPAWIAAVPEVRDAVKASSQEWYCRKEIQKLLALKPRRAQEILSVAGAVKDGNAFLLSRDNLVQYLEFVGKDVLAEEERRKRRLAGKLTDLRTEFIRQPKVLVEVKNEDVAKFQRHGLKALPPGITLAPGRITMEGFSTGEEALRLLMALALAIGRDQAEFEKAVEQAEEVRATK